MFRFFYTILFILIVTAGGYFLILPEGQGYIGGIIGLAFSVFIVFLRKRSSRLALKIFVGACLGIFLAGIASIVFFKVIDMLHLQGEIVLYIKIAILLFVVYFGMYYGWIIGSRFSRPRNLARCVHHSFIHSAANAIIS